MCILTGNAFLTAPARRFAILQYRLGVEKKSGTVFWRKLLSLWYSTSHI